MKAKRAPNTVARSIALTVLALALGGRVVYAQFASPTCVPPNCSPSVIQNIGLAGTTQTASINITGDAKIGSSLNLGAGTFAIPASGNHILANVASGGAGANLMNLQVAGVSKFIVDLTGVTAAALGAFTAPGYTFIGDTNTGMYSPGADQLAFTSGGVARMTMNSGGIYIPNGQLTMNTAGVLPTAPGYSFNTDSNTGMYRSANDTLNFSTNGTSRLQIDPAGAVSIPGNLTVTGTFSSTGGLSGSGAGLTSLNASNISSGTLADARLSSNVALLNGFQTFTGNNNFTTTTAFSGSASFSGNATAFNGTNVTFNNYPALFTATPLSLATSGGVNLGGSPLVLGASENLVYGIASNASTGSLLKLQTYSGTYDNKFVVDMQGNTTIAGNLNVTGTVSGSGLASASGTANKVAKFTAGSVLGDSTITDNAGAVSIGNNSPTSNGISLGNNNIMDAGNSVAIGYGLNVPSFTNPVISMGGWDGGTRITTPCGQCVTIGFRAPGPSFIFKGKQTSVGFPLMMIDGTNAAHDLISAAETPDVDMNLSRTVRFTGPGSIGVQRAVVIRPATYSSANPSTTITSAATFAVTGAPTAGANASITNPYAMWVQAGNTRLDGNLGVGINPNYKLHVGGNSYFSSGIGIGMTPDGNWGIQTNSLAAGGGGLYAQSSIAGTTAIIARANASGNTALRADAPATNAYGVYSDATDVTGIGGYFRNVGGGTNVTLAGSVGGSPYAGYFTGNVAVSGTEKVGGVGAFPAVAADRIMAENPVGDAYLQLISPAGGYLQGIGFSTPAARNGGQIMYLNSNGSYYFYGNSLLKLYIDGTGNTSVRGNLTVGNTSTAPSNMAIDARTFTGTIGYPIAPDDASAGNYNGSMYFNTATNKFRCNEGFAWKDCVVSGGLTGSGTTNYVPRFTGASTLANGSIQDDGTTVAIGNTPAGGALLAVGPTFLSNAIIGTTNAANGVGVYGFGLGATSIGLYGQGQGSGVFGLGAGASGVGLQGTGSYAGVTGTTANVWGYGVQGSVPAGSWAHGVYGITPSTNATSAGVAGLSTSAGMGGYFQATQANSYALVAYNGAPGRAFQAQGTSYFTDNVGIGTTPSSYKLDVTGSVRINSGTLGVQAVPDAQRGIFVNTPSGGINAIYASGPAGGTTITSTAGGNGTAVMGNNQAGNGTGVYGFSQNGYGLRGQADSAGGYGTYSTGYQAGVYGSSSTGYGLQGVSTAASGWGIMGSGTQYGIVGYTASANGSAYFYNGSGDGYAYLSKGTTAAHLLNTAGGLGLLVESSADVTGVGTGGKIKVRDTSTSKYMLFDDNEIEAFDAAAAPSFLHINNDGGTIVLTGGAAGAVGIGTTAPNYKLTVAGDIYANGGWLRTSGNAGWYNESYGGGWYMTDSSYIRNYNGKTIAADAGIWQPDYEPVVYVYANSECCSAPDKPIIAHSPNYPSYGIWYQDIIDRFQVKSASFGLSGLPGYSSYSACFGPLNTGGYTLGQCVSSIRFKKDVQDLDLGLEAVLKLRPREFRWKDDGRKDLGFIAEEAEQVDPLLVTYYQGQVEGVKYPQLTAMLAKAIQELNMRIEGMEVKYDERLDDNERRIRLLEDRVKALESEIKDLR